MKKYYIIILVFAVAGIIYSFTPADNEPTTIISGTIKNNGSSESFKRVTFEFPDYIRSSDLIQSTPDSSGNFSIKITLEHPTDFYLNVGRKILFYIKPGDSLHFEIDPEIISKKNSVAKLYSFITLTGTSQKVNEDIMKFEIELSKLINRDKEEKNFNTMNALEYKAYIKERSQKTGEVLTKFNKKKKTSTEFQEWINYNLQYWEWNDLTEYTWEYPDHKDIDIDTFYRSLPTDYFDYLINWDMNDRKAEITTYYVNFLKNLSKKIELECGLELNKDEYAYLKKCFPCYQEKIKTYESQYIQDILLSRYLARAIRSKTFPHVESVYQPDLIQDSIINSKIKQYYNSIIKK